MKLPSKPGTRTKYSWPVLLGCLLAVGSGSTSALAVNWLPLEHSGNASHDPNSGLEWLDLRLTAGQSYSSILNGWSGYTTAGGFRFATRNEVLGLFIHAGATSVNTSWSPSDAQPSRYLLSFLGTTLAQSEIDRSWLLYDPATEPSLPTSAHVGSAVFGIWKAPSGNQGVFQVPGLFPLRDYASYEIASALVRVVPEPSLVVLLPGGFGLTLLVMYRTNRRRCATNGSGGGYPAGGRAGADA
jgi:hypothetical protein